MTEPIWAWGVFLLVVLAMLMVDLGVFHRKAHVPSMKEAAIWSIVWIVVALIFNAVVWVWLGHQKALEFFTGYLVEKALSADNIFVFAVLFNYFAVPPEYRHRVLFWGVFWVLSFSAHLHTGRNCLAQKVPLGHLHLRHHRHHFGHKVAYAQGRRN